MLRQPGLRGRDVAHAGLPDPSGTHRVPRGQLHALGSADLTQQVRTVGNDALHLEIHQARHLLRVVHRPHPARTVTFSPPPETQGGRGQQY
jgi:hypothetical protein